MTRPIRIADLEEEVRWEADQERAVLRHTSVRVRKSINQSIQRFRELFSENSPTFLTSWTGTAPPGAMVSPQDPTISFSWGGIDMADIEPGVVRVYRVEVHQNNETMDLSHIDFAERNDWSCRSDVLGVPSLFFIYDETKLALLPPPMSGYKITIWYLPELPSLLDDDDEFNPGVPGAEQWVVMDCCMKLMRRDKYPDAYAAFAGERATLEAEILDSTKNQRSGPAYRLDTRNKRLRSRRRTFTGSVS
jgi:hypothetical protein